MKIPVNLYKSLPASVSIDTLEPLLKGAVPVACLVQADCDLPGKKSHRRCVAATKTGPRQCRTVRKTYSVGIVSTGHSHARVGMTVRPVGTEASVSVAGLVLLNATEGLGKSAKKIIQGTVDPKEQGYVSVIAASGQQKCFPRVRSLRQTGEKVEEEKEESDSGWFRRRLSGDEDEDKAKQHGDEDEDKAKTTKAAGKKSSAGHEDVRSETDAGGSPADKKPPAEDKNPSKTPTGPEETVEYDLTCSPETDHVDLFLAGVGVTPANVHCEHTCANLAGYEFSYFNPLFREAPISLEEMDTQDSVLNTAETTKLSLRLGLLPELPVDQVQEDEAGDGEEDKGKNEDAKNKKKNGRLLEASEGDEDDAAAGQSAAKEKKASETRKKKSVPARPSNISPLKNPKLRRTCDFQCTTPRQTLKFFIRQEKHLNQFNQQMLQSGMSAEHCYNPKLRNIHAEAYDSNGKHIDGGCTRYPRDYDPYLSGNNVRFVCRDEVQRVKIFPVVIDGAARVSFNGEVVKRGWLSVSEKNGGGFAYPGWLEFDNIQLIPRPVDEVAAFAAAQEELKWLLEEREEGANKTNATNKTNKSREGGAGGKKGKEGGEDDRRALGERVGGRALGEEKDVEESSSKKTKGDEKTDKKSSEKKSVEDKTTTTAAPTTTTSEPKSEKILTQTTTSSSTTTTLPYAVTK